MRYIDAGYAAALGTLFVYGVSLVVRRGRLVRLAAKLPAPEPAVPASGMQAQRTEEGG